jgi:hypothetical protein
MVEADRVRFVFDHDTSRLDVMANKSEATAMYPLEMFGAPTSPGARILRR